MKPLSLVSVVLGTAVLGSALLSSGSAHAYELSGYMWNTDDLPLKFFISDYLEDSLPQSQNPDNGLYYQEEALLKSYCNWNHQPDGLPLGLDPNVYSTCDDLGTEISVYEDAPCAAITFAYGGLHAGHEGPTNDGINKVYFDDPGDDAGAGVNGFMRPRTENILIKEVGGEFIYHLVDADIVFNDNIDWGTTDDIDAGCVGGEMALESTATHEVGHLWGLGHSCEQDDICSNDAFLSATMFWTGGPCDTSRAAIGSDDIQSITALYGPFATFTTEDERFGKAPLELCFDLVTEDVISSANWNFGDGESSDKLEPCHTYEDQGQFTVTAELVGLSETCGEWSFDYRELAYVLVCEVPLPEFTAESVEGTDTLVYQMINDTDVSTYGCIDEIEWKVWDGTEEIHDVGAWSPKFEFPHPGDYTVQLTVGGHAGNAVAELTVSVEEQPAGFGCATSRSLPLGGGLATLMLAMLGLVRRRR